MSLSKTAESKWIRFSLYSGLTWLILGSAVIGIIVKNNAIGNLFVFIEFCLLCFASLFSLSKAVAELIRFASLEDEKKAEVVTSIVAWGFLKFAALGVIIWRMIATEEQFGLALALGVATLFVVPMSSAFIDKMKRT